MFGKVKIKHEKPPIWDKLQEAGMRPDPDNIFITYGDTIYIPSGRQIPDYTIEHEKVHMRQQKEYTTGTGACRDSCFAKQDTLEKCSCGTQKSGPDIWWDRYPKEDYFRLEQEYAGYVRQYEYMCKFVKDRNQRSRIALDIAGSLASATYGDLIGQTAAYHEIIKRANV